jgi:hypothetical protein
LLWDITAHCLDMAAAALGTATSTPKWVYEVDAGTAMATVAVATGVGVTNTTIGIENVQPTSCVTLRVWPE